MLIAMYLIMEFKIACVFVLAFSIHMASSQSGWRPPAQAKINVPGETTYIQTPGDGTYNHSRYIVEDRMQLVFDVKVCSGALIAFTDFQTQMNQEITFLEIGLGVEDNTKMEFRRPGSVGSALFSTFVKEPLHCNEFRTFWISWYSNNFVLGRGPIVNEQTLMNWVENSENIVNTVAITSEKGHSAVWRISENSASYQAMHTFGEHHYSTLWKSVEGKKFWTFSVMASNAHAYILLSEKFGTTDSNVYEFGLGLDTPANDRVLLRTEVGGPADTVKAEIRLANVIVTNELREFWISWYQGQIEIGRGSVYGKRRLLLWNDPVPFIVRYLSIATGAQSYGRWLLHDDQESINYLYTKPSSSTDPQLLYNNTWVVTPRVEYFRTTVTACQEASILLSRDLEVFMGESIEIIIGASGNSRTLVRYAGQTDNIAEVDTVGIMSCTEPRHIWLSWHSGTLRLGRGIIHAIDTIIDIQVPFNGWNVGGLALATRIADGEWRVQESIGERVVVRTPSVFTDFSHYWRTVYQQNFLVFRVKACSDCHVALSPTLGVDPEESYYDLVISGYNNQFTLLHQITGVDRVVISQEVHTPGILDCDRHVDMWVDWAGPTIRMGLGSQAGYHVNFTHTFDMEHFPIKAVSFSTGYGNEGDFIVDEDYSDYFMFYSYHLDHVRWLQMMTSEVTWFPVRVRACTEIVMYLCAQQNQQNCYEVYIGSQSNTKSSISVRGQQVTEVDTPDVLSCLNDRNFWVRWTTTQGMDVGHGTIPGHNVMLSHQNSNPISVAFIGFESFGDDFYARWKIDKNAVRSLWFLTPTHLTYEQVWESVTRRNFVTFGVTACSDVHVILSTKVRWTNNVLDLFIGGWYNQRSMIREANGGPEYVSVDTPGILHCSERRHFWITWIYGAIEVGRGEIVGKDEFMDYQPLMLYQVSAVGYSTGYDNNGTWFIKSAPELIPTEPPVTPAPPFTDPPYNGGGGGSLTPDQVAGIVLGVLAGLMVIAVIVIHIRTKGSDMPIPGAPTSAGRYPSTHRDTDAIAPDNEAPEQQRVDAEFHRSRSSADDDD